MKKLESIEKEVCEKYLKGISNKELSEYFKVHRVTIQSILKRNNVILRKKEETSRKYFLQNFKGEIITNNDAYILGLIWADGNLSRNCIEISLQKDDEQILRDISEYIYNENTLTYREGKKMIINNAEYICKPQMRFRITSKEVANKLRLIGLIENKSLTCSLPTIDSKFIPHFMRGLMDGDGSIYSEKKNCMVRIVGNHKICKEISDIVNNNLKIESKVYCKTENVSTFTISGRLQILKFLEWIYKDSELKLQRKYNKYIELL